MSGPLDFLPSLAIGLTVLLGAGSLALALVRAPFMRHRLADLSLTGCLLTAAILAVPLSRPLAPKPNAVAAIRIPPPVHADSPAAPGVALEGPSSAEATVATSTESAAPGFRLSLGTLWLLGAGLVGLRLAVSFVILGRTLVQAQPAPQEVLDRLPALGPTAQGLQPRVLHSPAIRRPVCFGGRSGTILLPTELLDPARSGQLQAVLLHELAHLSMGHGLAQLRSACAAPLLFWNPLYWLHARVIGRNAEYLADDVAGRRLGRHGYASALLALAQSQAAARQPSAWIPSPGVGVFDEPEPFYARMSSLLQRNDPLGTRCSARQRVATCGALASLMAVVGCTLGKTPEPHEPATASPSGTQSFEAEDLSDLAQRVLELDSAGEEPTSLRIKRGSQGQYDVLISFPEQGR